ncbi:hypothetical protein C9F11_10325 [Streptomyces sp. YIM 121038]|uniref:DUF397 domain-containing protein n=1 Tax=Streptomyces sp. YIM 121038 TaxID=2136401 RepID=UPI001110B224|nr:DUF397 domain-containing protein [Streptomyces sp. YIM 121038]QCX75745.1 hypothetical protein C9F11_10325 [Streptomyces sp. YIM 121038]
MITNPPPANSWARSSYSGPEGGNCVECAHGATQETMYVRDSKKSEGPVLAVSAASWAHFISFAATH